jgi:hypothetical protein
MFRLNIKRYYRSSDEIIDYLSRIQLEAKLPGLIVIDNLIDFVDPSVHDKVHTTNELIFRCNEFI